MARRQPQAPLPPHAGRALADLITRIVVGARSAMLPAEQEAVRRRIESQMEDYEGALGDALANVLTPLFEHTDLPDSLAFIRNTATAPKNQTDFLLNLVGVIGGVFYLMGAAGGIVWQDNLNDLAKRHRHKPLAPADAADAVERGILTADEGDRWAAQSAIDKDAFNKMVLLTGEPPGVIDMLRLWRRGELDEKTLDRMIAYSRIRTEWTPEVKRLAYDVLPAADVVEGYIKGHINHAEAITRWKAAGGKEEEFDLAALIAGNPIGVEAAARLYNHGLITKAELDLVIRSSRINPQFEHIAELLHYQFLSAFQIERMLTQGTVTPKQASEWLIQDGYPADQVAGLVAGATTTKAAKAKNVSSALVIDSYEAGLIDKAKATEQLQALGYHGEEATIELESYDARRILQIVGQGVTYVRKAFLARHLTLAQASSELDSLGVHPLVRDHYLSLWNVELKAEIKEFTKAEIGSMFKKSIIKEETAVRMWVEIGYTTAQANLLAYEYGKSLPGNKPVL